jgi:hypothetical protein
MNWTRKMSDVHKYYKEESRKPWYTTGAIGSADISLGCQMRIADALEKIATERVFTQLENAKRDVEFYKMRTRDLERKVRGLRGALTRAKKK